MVPRTQPHRQQTPHDIREDVIRIEVPPIREQGLQELAADSQEGGADGQGEIECAAARGVEDPVEAEREEEEGEEVQGLVVDVQGQLEGGETEVGRCEEEEEEGACVASVVSFQPCRDGDGAAGGIGGGRSGLPAKGRRMRMVNVVVYGLEVLRASSERAVVGFLQAARLGKLADVGKLGSILGWLVSTLAGGSHELRIRFELMSRVWANKYHVLISRDME